MARVRRVAEAVADIVVAHGGSLSGEHGDGRLRGELLVGRREDDRGALLAESGEEIKAAPSRHLDVEQEEVRHRRFDFLDRLARRSRLTECRAGGNGAEHSRQLGARRLLVIHDQDVP